MSAPFLQPSGYADTFARDHLPPADQWPTLEFTTDWLHYPYCLNAGAELLDAVIAKHGPHRPPRARPTARSGPTASCSTCTNQIAHVLVDDLGLVSGNRVLLRSPNNPWTVAAWLGVLKAGGIVVTTMAALRATELAPIVQKTRPALALVDHRFVADVHTVRDSVAPTWSSSPTEATPKTTSPIASRATPATSTPSNTAADDVALFGPTSGTTGVPKIPRRTSTATCSRSTTPSAGPCSGSSPTTVACTAPLAFTFGLGMLVVFTLRAGACALLTESATPAQLADLVAGARRHRALATAPTAYKQILASGRIEKLCGLRVAVSAGEHMAQATWERIEQEIGLKVVDGIGATEMLHIFISAAGDDIRPGATGKPVAGYRAAILDTDGNELGDGQEGRLGVIGPVGCRYLDDERQRGYVVNGWNVTGDTFVRDADGYYFYRSRTDNMIVSSGYNISGPEVEEALATHPDVVEVGVVAAPHEERGAIVCAFVVLREDVEGDAGKVKELQDHVKGRLAPYKYPRAVRFLNAMPRNTSGKLQHFKLRQMAESEGPEGSE